MPSRLGRDDPLVNLTEQSSSVNMMWGEVRSVDPEKQEMEVEISGGNAPIMERMPINNMITNNGFGVRLMPIVNITKVLVYKDPSGAWFHIGYFLRNLGPMTSNSDGSNQSSTTLLLQRYLEGGEVQMIGLTGNEVLLANDGSVLIKNQFGAYIKLENYSSTLEGSFANLKFEMEDVVMRGGNVRRATKTTLEDEQIFVSNDEIKKEQDIEDGESVTAIPEFTIDVGVDSTSPTSSPSVGTISMAQRMINPDGTEDAVSGLGINFKVNMDNGGGIAIGEDGSFYILDRNGGNTTRFESGSFTEGDKSFRVGNNYVTISGQNGVEIAATGGANIELKPDGMIKIKAGDGRYIEFNSQGGLLSFPGATLTIAAEDINLIYKNLTLGSGGGDSLIGLRKFAAAVYDLHVHAGPAGKPVLPMMAMLTNPALNPSVPGITVSA